MKKIGKAEKRLGIDSETNDRLDEMKESYGLNKKVLMHEAVRDMYEFTVKQNNRYNINQGDSE